MKQRGRLDGLDTPGFDDALCGLLLTSPGSAERLRAPMTFVVAITLQPGQLFESRVGC